MTLEDAIEIAVKLHRGQVDKQGQPAILHPLHVMMQMDDEKGKILAVLHDALEDGDLLQQGEILSGLKYYGHMDIHDALIAITRKNGEPYSRYISRVNKNELATRVKLKDLRHNIDRCIHGGKQFDELRRKYVKARARLLKP